MSAVGQLPHVPNPDKIREVTQEVLSRPEFSKAFSWEDLIYFLLNTVREWLDSLVDWSVKNPGLARILAIVLVLAMVASLVHILYLAVGDLLPFGRGKERGATRSSRWDILEGAAKNWREALEAARRMLNEGNPRRAIWLAHRVLLGLLDEQGAIRFAGWKTNSHYLRECAASHPWYPTFTELTELYEQAIYAHRAAAPSIVESLLLRVDRLWEERST